MRREEYRAGVAEWCGERVVLGRELAAAKPHGPFWLILDSLGGSALGAALGMLQPGGVCVTFGVSEAAHTTFESRNFFATGGVRLYGLTLFHELMSVERAGIGLALLADLIAAKKLQPQIAVTRTDTSSRSGSRNSTGLITSRPGASGSTTTARTSRGMRILPVNLGVPESSPRQTGAIRPR